MSLCAFQTLLRLYSEESRLILLHYIYHHLSSQNKLYFCCSSKHRFISKWFVLLWALLAELKFYYWCGECPSQSLYYNNIIMMAAVMDRVGGARLTARQSISTHKVQQFVLHPGSPPNVFLLDKNPIFIVHLFSVHILATESVKFQHNLSTTISLTSCGAGRGHWASTLRCR